jgi:nucleotide-binding universal stress UspA family protein
MTFGKDGATAHACAGNPAQAICEVASTQRADLIVVGRHGHRGPQRYILGSVPTRVLQLARCDVLVVQPKDYAKA